MGNTHVLGQLVAGLVLIALATTILAHPQTSNVVKAVGGSTADVFRAVQGK